LAEDERDNCGLPTVVRVGSIRHCLTPSAWLMLGGCDDGSKGMPSMSIELGGSARCQRNFSDR
ncbi:MAG TPA: hypothetical protein VFT74_06500, partial [Isosphaeraceae bacterium]|nr:hypothetical protein [Isosphaeraceae bacterium]